MVERFEKTAIPGLVRINLAVHRDERGWFKENYRADQLSGLGLTAGFTAVQNNISFNRQVGTTRGIHAEPWNKYISLATGRIFAAIVDLRPGVNFGRVECFELTAEVAIFVPKGCGNSFQTLEPDTVYTYLVDGYWTPQAKYTLVNLNDPTLKIPWPIPLSKAEISPKDRAHPSLGEVKTADQCITQFKNYGR